MSLPFTLCDCGQRMTAMLVASPSGETLIGTALCPACFKRIRIEVPNPRYVPIVMDKTERKRPGFEPRRHEPTP